MDARASFVRDHTFRELEPMRRPTAEKSLGVKTETEALNGALDLLIYGKALARGTEAMLGEEYNDVLGVAGEVPT